MGGVVAFAGSRSVVSPLVTPAVRAVLASGRSLVVGDAAGVDAAVAAVAGAAAQVVACGAGGRWAPAVRTRAVVAAALAGGPGSALVAFPAGPCPEVCRPVPGAALSGRVTGGGSGSWLAVALAVGAGLPVVVFLPAGVAPPAWPGGSWVPAAASGPWAAAVRWSPALLFGIPCGSSR